jgi:hypothetical protein
VNRRPTLTVTHQLFICQARRREFTIGKILPAIIIDIAAAGDR